MNDNNGSMYMLAVAQWEFPILPSLYWEGNRECPEVIHRSGTSTGY